MPRKVRWHLGAVLLEHADGGGGIGKAFSRAVGWIGTIAVELDGTRGSGFWLVMVRIRAGVPVSTNRQ